MIRTAFVVGLGACASASVRQQPSEAGSPVAALGTVEKPGLPAIVPVSGAPLAIKLQYPANNQLLSAADSNFVFGSVGSGDATLAINGERVSVAPNGAFLAWLPAPFETSRYDITVSRGSDTLARAVPVRFPDRKSLPDSGRLIVDSSSLSPGRGWWAEPGELMRVSIRAPRNAQVHLLGSNGALRQMFAPETAAASEQDDPATFATEIDATLLADSLKPARVMVTRPGSLKNDSISLALPHVRLMRTDSRVLARLASRSTVGSDTDKVVNARTIVDGTYKWLLLPGTILEVTGRRQGFTRVRLDQTLDVWVDSNDLLLLPEGTALPRRVTGGFRVIPSREWVDVLIGTGDRPAHLVESEGRTLTLLLYGVQANPAISPIIGNDTLIRRISWDQETSDRVRVTFALSQPVYGWLSLWDDARKTFVLRVRRAPAIDPAHPLRGMTIAVDPGHPPIGATGPTGLYEGDAVFPVGMKLVELLKAKGANAFSTRTSLDAVGLAERSVAARRANANLFISIHLNGLPDGVNPFTNNGTSTLFFHNASEPLARFVQRELMQRFGLRDLGVHYQNLSVARPTWYPSALAEGLFLMIPEQEAAMRSERFQSLYAEGLAAGVESYFRWLGSGKP